MGQTFSPTDDRQSARKPLRQKQFEFISVSGNLSGKSVSKLVYAGSTGDEKLLPRWKNGIAREMLVSKSITFDEENLRNVAAAAETSHAYTIAESEYLERLRSGDAAAFDNLITRYGGDIYGLLYRLTGDAEEAADLTQETFMSALKGIRSFRGDAELKTWLFRIALNQSRNRFRWWKRRHRSSTVSLDEPSGPDERPFSDGISDPGESPEEKVLRLERRRRLTDALLRLPEIYRVVVVLCDVEGFTYEEISQALEVNIGTVKSRIARGREELRRLLTGF